MKKYLQILKMFIQEELDSPINLLLNLLLNSIGIFALLLLWEAIYNNQEEIFGISQNAMIRYFLGVLIIGKLIKLGSDDYFKEKIESGDIITDFVKPINYLFFLFIRSVAKLIVYFSGLVIVVILFSIYFNISPIKDFSGLIYSIPTTILAFFLGFFITSSISSLFFYFPDLKHFSFVARDIVIGLMAGIMFNIELLTGTLYTIFEILPFKYIVNFPVLVLNSSINTDRIQVGIIIQILWTIVSGLGAFLLFKQGYKKYTSYGG